MNPKPIDLAKDADLRGAWAALQRASATAARIAKRTGTRLVVVKSAVVREKQKSGSSKRSNTKKSTPG